LIITIIHRFTIVPIVHRFAVFKIIITGINNNSSRKYFNPFGVLSTKITYFPKE